MKLSNKIIVDTTLSNEALLVYAGLKKGFREFSTVVPINPNFIFYLLTGNSHIVDWQVRLYKTGIQELAQRQLIEIVEETKQYKIVCLKNIALEEKEYFSRIEEQEYKTILNYTNTKQDIQLFRLFTVLMATTSQNSLYQVFSGTTSQEYQLSLIPMDYKTYLKYYRILENDIRLIHTYRPYSFYYNEGEKISKGVPNTYGRYRDAELIDKIGNEYLLKLQSENTVPIKQLSGKANLRRSAPQIYMHWIGGKDYDYEILKRVYSTLREMNYMYSKDYSKKERVRDLSKFKKYDFYEGEC